MAMVNPEVLSMLSIGFFSRNSYRAKNLSQAKRLSYGRDHLVSNPDEFCHCDLILPFSVSLTWKPVTLLTYLTSRGQRAAVSF